MYKRQTFTQYANQHGYKVFVLHEPLDHRPASWSKLPLMLEFVGGWDTIVCIDVDAMIMRWDKDYFQEVLDNNDGNIAFGVEGAARTPNCGLWIVRGKREGTVNYLKTVDGMDGYYHNGTVEQAAVHKLLGYSKGVPSVAFVRDTILLSPRYNDCFHVCDDAIVRHWAGQSHQVRIAGMSRTLGELGLEPTPMKRIES